MPKKGSKDSGILSSESRNPAVRKEVLYTEPLREGTWLLSNPGAWLSAKGVRTTARIISHLASGMLSGLKSRMMAPVSPYHTFNLKDLAGETVNVNLDAVLESILMDFRVTLRQHDVEFLAAPLTTVPSDEERVHRFFRTSMGRVVQFGRRGPVDVIVEGHRRQGGYDVIITASRGESDKLLLVGRFLHPSRPDIRIREAGV